MKRYLMITLTVVLALGAFADRAPENIYFYAGTINTAQTNVALPYASEWILVTNDGDSASRTVSVDYVSMNVYYDPLT